VSDGSAPVLLRGYEQELTNGKHLRNAYVYAGRSEEGMFKDGEESLASSDPRMRLFDLDGSGNGSGENEYEDKRPYEEPHLYYRADDEQRTLMSGQVLLRGLWGPEIVADAAATAAATASATTGNDGAEDPIIVLHTADYKYDVLGSNWRDCPRLEDLEKEANESDLFQKFNSSDEAVELRRIAAKLGTNFDTDDWIDCLMTTMCTDRPLPDVLNDYDGGDDSVFQRILDFVRCGSCFFIYLFIYSIDTSCTCYVHRLPHLAAAYWYLSRT